ncbi:uncharacterized protein DUF4149 [Roseibium hamelinense]|uniref:Uncharacterized protein DUF4149 n=1 Tax=Roseibium hamelinense TaxID=150831 RepID=A0A562TA21_9HYPH|nr:DUF4149 domain-containing protein [Roseibium hamelinense]MTI42226.1 DUF4149 domain-containing protein [Roseibium hamelinense]TWI90557.1 uncharacterized protein DUF4149 [Roseibium hamelinense]
MEYLSLLAVSTLFGGMMLYSFGFAPLVFHALDGETAGRFLRAAFPWYYLFVTGCAGFSAFLLAFVDWRPAAGLLVVALTGLAARELLMPRINDARDQDLAGDISAKKRFAWLHGGSVVLNMLQLVGLGAVLYGYA